MHIFYWIYLYLSSVKERKVFYEALSEKDKQSFTRFTKKLHELNVEFRDLQQAKQIREFRSQQQQYLASKNINIRNNGTPTKGNKNNQRRNSRSPTGNSNKSNNNNNNSSNGSRSANNSPTRDNNISNENESSGNSSEDNSNQRLVMAPSQMKSLKGLRRATSPEVALKEQMMMLEKEAQLSKLYFIYFHFFRPLSLLFAS